MPDFQLHSRGLTMMLALGFMALEYGLARLTRRDAHDLKESAATFGVAVGQVLIRGLEAGLLAIPFSVVQAHRLFTLDLHRPWVLAGLFFGSELIYYAHHRAAHRVRWLWATHSVHHSPTRLNFTAAIRLGWTGNISGNFLFFLPLIWLGYPPLAVVAMLGVNLLYQFFIHTELVGSLGPLEWVLNTPMHHRVHHASNAACLDRNYGGILILFDRLFGSFAAAPADEPLRYGLVGGERRLNPIEIALGGWVQLLADTAEAPGVFAGLKTLFGPPGAVPPAESRPMLSLKLPTIALLVAVGLTTVAQAQTPPATPDPQGKGRALAQVCRPDFDRLCQGTQPGGGRILACLKSHDSELSPACKQGVGGVGK